MSYQTGDPLGMRLRIAPGANLSNDPSTYTWQEITYDLVMDVAITYDEGAPDEAGETNSQFTCSLRDNRGRYDPDNAESDLWPYFDLQCGVEWAVNLGDGSGWNILFSGYMASVIEDFSSGTPHKVRRAITAAGPFRRLGQSKSAFSAMTRYYRTVKPIMYWRMEDLADSRQAQSDVAGRPAMILPPNTSANLPVWAQRTGMPGSLPVAQFTPGATLSVAFPPYVPQGSTIRVAFLANLAVLTTATTMFRMTMVGSNAIAWEIFVAPGGSPRLRALDATGATLFSSTNFAPPSGFLGNSNNGPILHPWLLYAITLQQSGADIIWTLNYGPIWINDIGDPDGFTTLPSGTLAATQVGQPTGFIISPNAAAEDMAVGHLSLSDSGIGLVNALTNSAIGWPQTTSQRVAGVANEFGVPNAIIGSSSAKMGAQQLGTVLAMLRDAMKADHGIVSDGRGVVTYRTLNGLYNLTPMIRLDGANRELFQPYAPVRDDQKHRNRITVTRTGGSSYLADNLADQARTGLADGSETINLAADIQLPDHAGYFLAVGTVGGKRYPQFTLDFLRAPEFARPWLGMRLGDRFLLTNPPRASAKDDVQLQLRGFKQRWEGRYKWTATCNTIKADPFNVGVLDDPILGRAEADLNAVTVTSEVSSQTTTSFNVNVAADTPPIIDSTNFASDFPVDLNWDGERITMTSCGPSLLDAFGRTVSNSFGSADTGQAYTTTGGATSDFNVGSGVGTISATSVNVFRNALIDTGVSDHTVSADFSLPVTSAAAANISQWLLARCTDTSNYYAARLELTPSGTIVLTLAKRVTTTLTGLVGITVGTGHVAGDLWRVTIDVHGTTVRCKAWVPATTGQPGWQGTVTDTDLTTGTLTGVQYRLETGNTNTLPVVLSVDNLTVSNPVTMTVARSVNRVHKIHKIGSAISLWQPMVVAL